MEVEEAINKLEQTLWTTKSIVTRKIKKSEETLVAPSDLELESRLELFSSIDETTTQTEIIMKIYKERLCLLASEEAALANFLRDVGKADKTGAGKVMGTAAKAMAQVAQQRAALRHPIMRLHQEVVTFRKRAIADSAKTVAICEKKRDDYKGSLMWMANVSQTLDPDATRQMMKFRKVQGQVKDSKKTYDGMKLIAIQKIDLLAAARSNLFSHSIANYQKMFIEFLTSSSQCLETAAERLKEPVKFRFSVLKELGTLESLNEERVEGSSNDKLLFDFDYSDQKPSDESTRSIDEGDGDLIDTSQLLAELNDALDGFKAVEPETTDLLDLGLSQIGQSVNKNLVEADFDFADIYSPLVIDGLANDLSQMLDLKSAPEVYGSSSVKKQEINPTQKTETKSHVKWFDLFSELDPLAKRTNGLGDC
ncbi:islet cell autoantigen 1-like [Artemia franciscana]|uniref:AH domain-containing protein n=1 Tax=Artemia franciscana TaxID=6661 RepID=A0AA88H3Q4_ARTSF|nr:hypothetical protein QYM36_017650 [Artemia franciscana]KAK2706756.1 hypothetical protein QYM36_014707 [Artemia franciscana]